MKKIILTLLLSLLFVYTSYSQWQQVFTAPNIVNDFTTSGSNLFAATNSNGVYISVNNGSNWQQTSLVQTVYSLETSGNIIYAGLSNSGISRTTNNGANWIQTSQTTQFITNLAVNGNNVIGSTGSPENDFYISTNGGNNFTMVSGALGDIYKIAYVGNTLFSGQGVSGVLRSTNNGFNWITTQLNSGICRGIAGINNYVYAGTSSGLFISSNSGVNWVESSLSTQTFLSVAVDGNNVFASAGNGGVWVSNNNGANWVQKNEGLTGISIDEIHIHNGYIFAAATMSSNRYIYRRPISELTGIETISEEIPNKFSLQQNYPNPFNPATNIEFSIPRSSNVKLAVYDVNGREVEVLVNQNLSIGTYKADWNASNYSSGIYFYAITAGNFSETKRMVLVK